ncbi:MAG: sulfate transporter [Burkholderiaceae bacterium]|nr:sulfate transporter [Burkholderiaceae bacterium]
MSTNYWRGLAHDITTPSRLIPALSSGFIVGLIIIVIELSLATLIFSGSLAGFAPAAAGLTLFGGFIMCLVVALGSSFQTSVSLPEDAPAAILAAVAAGIATQLASDPDPRAAFVTVGTAIILSSLTSGVLFLLMGRFGLGKLMRYLPYPVIGGFLAGVGWLLVQGSFSIMTGVSLSLAELPQLLTADKLLLAAPGVALALTLLFAIQRWRSVFILPGVLLAALGAFTAYLAANGQGFDDAARNGLLLVGMPEQGGLWPVFGMDDLERIRWSALLPQLPQLATIPLVSAISFLLVAGGIETAAHHDLDLQRELYLNGIANLIGGAGGAHTGYTALSFSMLGPKIGSDSRLVGIVAALLTGIATFFGAAVLGCFPRFILGGLILFFGAAMLLDWVVNARRQVGRVEYGLILTILCAIGFFGFLNGVGCGLILATIIFAVKYSRLPVVRQDSDATQLTSTRLRPLPDRLLLRERGANVRVLQTMGYLFFGSANSIANTAAGHLQPASGRAPTHLIIDFADIDGFDSSAVNCFLRMQQRASAAGCQLVFSAAPVALVEQMCQASPQETATLRFLSDLDHALEYCEDALLAQHSADNDNAAQRERLFDLAVDDLLLRLEENERFEALVDELDSFLEHRSVTAGTTIVAQGEALAGVYLMLSGQAEETEHATAGTARRLRALGPGDMLGQISTPSKPSVTCINALSDCTLGLLSAETLREIETKAPASALAFYRLFAARIEARLMPTV